MTKNNKEACCPHFSSNCSFLQITLAPICFMQYSPLFPFTLFKFIVVMEIRVQSFDVPHHTKVIYENIAYAFIWEMYPSWIPQSKELHTHGILRESSQRWIILTAITECSNEKSQPKSHMNIPYAGNVLIKAFSIVYQVTGCLTATYNSINV